MRTTAAYTSPKRRVLVVDDYPDAADVTCLLLETLGHECRAVHDGAAALSEAARFDPDVVLVDLGLPDISGIEVGRELRRRAVRPILIAAVTGWSDDAIRDRTREAGFDQHVVKPTSRATLLEIFDKAAELPLRRPPREAERFAHA